VARCTREGLAAASRGINTPTSSVHFSPSLATDALPLGVATLQTHWPMNPFGALPSSESMGGSVMEFSLLDGGSRSSLALPRATSGDIPLYFRVQVALGQCCPCRVHCACRIQSLRLRPCEPMSRGWVASLATVLRICPSPKLMTQRMIHDASIGPPLHEF
jgi:hypothetical protein